MKSATSMSAVVVLCVGSILAAVAGCGTERTKISEIQAAVFSEQVNASYFGEGYVYCLALPGEVDGFYSDPPPGVVEHLGERSAVMAYTACELKVENGLLVVPPAPDGRERKALILTIEAIEFTTVSDASATATLDAGGNLWARYRYVLVKKPAGWIVVESELLSMA